MLTDRLSHAGRPPEPHDVWTAWNLDPFLVFALGLVFVLYRQGESLRAEHPRERWRSWCFTGGIVAIAIALVSPLDAMAEALASAHMAQHMLLVAVAAPLLAVSEPSANLVRTVPTAMLLTANRWRRRLGLSRSRLRVVRLPAFAWLLHTGTLWFWHAAAPYDAALRNELVHVVEHTTFLVTALLFWNVVVGSPRAGRVANGFGVMLLFTMAVQSTFLSALLTFARTPWYAGYATTTQAWGLDPLADQQLAGVIMWVPGGLVYVGAALALLVTLLHDTEREHAAAASRQTLTDIA